MGNWRDKNARAYVVSKEEWDARCHWDDLTQYEKGLCCSGGCGITLFGIIKPMPDFNFKPACCRHDFAYLRGGDERVRNLADRNFQEEVLKLAAEMPGNNLVKRWAITYSNVVKKWGFLAWDYGPMRSKKEILEEAIK